MSVEGELGPETRCGFVAVIGAPNAGKSTLVNTLVGTKVSIVSPKVQTTRSLVRGIALHGASQIVFVDTPGIFEQPKRRLERAMVSAAWTGSEDADAVLLVIDAARGITADTDAIITKLAESGRSAMLVLNKVDVADRAKLLDLTAVLNERLPFTETFMISALNADGTERLLDVLAAAMPSSPWLFPEDEVSDLPARMLAAEITREKLFLALRQELPYDCAVDTENWESRKDGSVRIDQVVYVTRESQKPIVLGKGGRQIKNVGESSRKELEDLLGCRVHLFLHVKVEPSWRERRGHFSAWGLDFDA